MYSFEKSENNIKQKLNPTMQYFFLMHSHIIHDILPVSSLESITEACLQLASPKYHLYWFIGHHSVFY